MLESALGIAAALLAVAGGLALLRRVLGSGARLALRSAEIVSATSRAELSERRGDLTGMQEQRLAERDARTRRRGDAARVLFWAGWLVVPLAAGWMPEGYALAAPLWLLGSRSPPARP